MAKIDYTKQKIFVSIKTPDRTLYEGEAYAVSGTNELGPFDVISEHANFICMIKDKVTVYLNEGFVRDFPIELGVLKAINNKVEVYLGIERLSKT